MGTTNYGLPQWGENEHVEISPDINTAFSAIDTNLDLIAPVGSILIWPGAGDVAPTKYLWCQGQAISRTTYAGLFAVLGTTYGAGDGSTTFALPNLKGRIPVGRDTMYANIDVVGETGGEREHVLTVPELAGHSHAATIINDGSNAVGGTTSFAVAPGGSAFAAAGTVNNIVIGNTGGGGAHNNLQPYIVMNYIIRALA